MQSSGSSAYLATVLPRLLQYLPHAACLTKPEKPEELRIPLMLLRCTVRPLRCHKTWAATHGLLRGGCAVAMVDSETCMRPVPSGTVLVAVHLVCASHVHLGQHAANDAQQAHSVPQKAARQPFS